MMSGAWMGVPDHFTPSLPQRVKLILVKVVAPSMKPCNNKEFELWRLTANPDIMSELPTTLPELARREC